MELYKIGNERSWLLIISLMTIMSAMLVNSSTGSEEVGQTWTTLAAKEAENVAAINCSGHGKACIDGIVVNGTIQCECNTCYHGANCFELFPNCPANAAVGDAMFLADYWVNHKVSSAILISGWSRMSYYTSGPDYISLELEKYIKLLHKLIGNADADCKYIVFDNGVMQLINSFVHVLSRPKYSSHTIRTKNVVSRSPYYPVTSSFSKSLCPSAPRVT